MRASTETRLLEVDPGTTTSVVVDIVNTGAVIDGVTANVIGLPDECVHTQPSLLPLFPASSGQLTVTLAIPPTHPAGRHPITIELVSHGAHLPSQYLDVDLDVSASPAMAMTPVPRIVRARRSGRFVLEVLNNGNVPLNVTMQAVDVERSTKATFTPAQVRVEPGGVAPVLLNVRGPRMITGGESDRAVQLSATALRADLTSEAEPGDDVATLAPVTTGVQLRQRPLVSRGLFTALILMSIVALWAGVFLFGLTKVFSNDPMTKAAPASFYMSSKAGAAKSGSSSGAQGVGAGSGADAAAAPVGTLPKTGQLPAGVGGEITGIVTSASEEKPVGRILVQAYRKTRDGIVKVSSAATQSDGTYALAGLFPTSYYLQFSSPGFKTVWYPNVPTMQGAKPVGATALGSTSGINSVITGLPASISGAVDPGDTVKSIRTVVTARPLNTVGGSATSKSVTTGAGGKYTIPGLKAPASYQLTFTTDGYQASSLIDTVNGGDSRLEPTVTLGAAEGGISGIVVNGTSANDQPIGGATVSTTVGGKTLSVLTPTTGAVGTFALGNLPTPATYVLTYSAPAHGTWTEVIELAAGQSYTKAVGKLTTGSGSISGRVLDVHNNGLGGATVTVGGAAGGGGTATPGLTVTAPTTTTLTSPPVGKFFLNGLADGDYTLTFSLDGYAPASVTVTIDSTTTAPTVRVRLSKQDGSIEGVVTHNGLAFPGATVTATDGLTTYTATSSAAGGALPAGGYLISGLKPGTYTVTASLAGLTQQTRIVVLRAGQTKLGQNLALGG
jgi:hypothetical protein